MPEQIPGERSSPVAKVDELTQHLAALLFRRIRWDGAFRRGRHGRGAHPQCARGGRQLRRWDYHGPFQGARDGDPVELGRNLAAAAPVVRAEDVHKYFGRSHVLRGMSLLVKKGEIVCIIGRSGSGKTTFLRCINRLERIDSGLLEVNGKLIGYRVGKNGALKEDSDSSVVRQRIDIGFVFQRLNLWPNKTALENIIEGPLGVWHLSRAEAVAQGERLLARVRLSEKRNGS